MQLTILFAYALSFASLFSQLFADSVEFGLVAIRSGSVLQYGSIGPNEDGLLTVSSVPSSTGKITDDGYLLLDNTSYLSINENNQYVVVQDISCAVDGVSIKNGNIAFNKSFIAHKVDNVWILYTETQSTEDDIPIAIAAITSNGSFAPDFPESVPKKAKRVLAPTYQKRAENGTTGVSNSTSTTNSTTETNSTSTTNSTGSTNGTTPAVIPSTNTTSGTSNSTSSAAENGASSNKLSYANSAITFGCVLIAVLF
ncbi:hypothetical protein ACO0SA_002359 [Hanseniaspora valbyensis]